MFARDAKAVVNLDALAFLAAKLLDEVNGYTHPFLNALTYADQNLNKNGKTEWSNIGVAISDNLAEILLLLTGNNAPGTDWMRKYNSLTTDINNKLSQIHKKIKSAKRFLFF